MRLWVQLGMTIATAGLAALALTSCNPENCKAGDDSCICDDTTTADCHWDCSGGDCDFQAAGQQSSSFSCDGAGCSLVVSDQADVAFDCNMGGCSLTAGGQSTVSLSCDAGNCTVTASDQAAVSLACAGGGCSATVNDQATVSITGCSDCSCTENAITASCEGVTGTGDDDDDSDWY